MVLSAFPVNRFSRGFAGCVCTVQEPLAQITTFTESLIMGVSKKGVAQISMIDLHRIDLHWTKEARRVPDIKVPPPVHLV